MNREIISGLLLVFSLQACGGSPQYECVSRMLPDEISSSSFFVGEWRNCTGTINYDQSEAAQLHVCRFHEDGTWTELRVWKDGERQQSPRRLWDYDQNKRILRLGGRQDFGNANMFEIEEVDARAIQVNSINVVAVHDPLIWTAVECSGI